MKDRLGDKLKSNGANVNPLKFLPSHKNVNSENHQSYSFDSDRYSVEAETSAYVDGKSCTFQDGFDSNYEGMIPLISRGNIAWCVMDMKMMHNLNYVNETDIKKLQQWIQENEPSDYERASGLWLRDETMFKKLNSNLKKGW